MKSGDTMKYKFIQPNTYKFSYIRYFIHSQIYKLIFLVAMFLLPLYLREQEVSLIKENPILIIFWWIIEFGIVIFWAFEWAKYSTSSFTVERGNVVYEHKKPNNDLPQDERGKWTLDVCYKIKSISKVKVNLNSIVIYGDIKKEISNYYGSGRPVHYRGRDKKRIRVIKCFKNNRELVQKLLNYNKKSQ